MSAAAALLLLLLAAFVAIKGEREAERAGAKKRMFPLIGMIVSGIFLTAFAGWYFWPTSRPAQADIAAVEKPSQKLKEFFVQSTDLLNLVVNIKNDISLEEYNIIDAKVEDWSLRLGNYIEEKFGNYEKSRMIDIDIPSVNSMHPNKHFEYAGNKPTVLLLALLAARKSLSRLIEEQSKTESGLKVKP